MFFVVVLSGQGHIEPKMFLEKECVDSYAEEYMFIGCIEFINKVRLWLC